MNDLTAEDMQAIDILFEMGGGYVLDFNNHSFGDFFQRNLRVDINNPLYSDNGTSKAKRLRSFLGKAANSIAADALQALLNYRDVTIRRSGKSDGRQVLRAEVQEAINRLQGKKTKAPSPAKNAIPDQAKFTELSSSFNALIKLEAKRRGYEFEKFLKSLFDSFGLEARAPFKLTGEQIDGSFLLGAETYLVEAKWQDPQTGAADLHVFQGKIEQRADWTRGLFISYSGYTSDGLEAFGRSRKKFICMDGLDIHQLLEMKISLSQVLEQKIRRAAETGRVYVPVRELFAF